MDKPNQIIIPDAAKPKSDFIKQRNELAEKILLLALEINFNKVVEFPESNIEGCYEIADMFIKKGKE